MPFEPSFERVKPDVARPGDAVQRPWVIVLSDWPPHDQALVRRIRLVNGGDEPGRALPTVLVVSDLPFDRAAHPELLADRRFLAELVDVGAIVLEPQDDEEREAVQADPYAFAVGRYARAATPLGPAHGSSAAPLSPGQPVPSQPDGYQEIATAVTPLSRQEMTELIEGRRSDDWRHEV